MKVILVFVSTLDGKITKWGDSFIKAWSSREDQEYFVNLWRNSALIVMGSNTFNADPLKPSPNHQYVVMTRSPAIYESRQVPGQLEFSELSPSQLIASYERAGHHLMVLVGGPHVATSFFKEQLIDEVWLSIEPLIFGIGGNFVIEDMLDIKLQLLSLDRVNKRGTLITKYQVVKN